MPDWIKDPYSNDSLNLKFKPCLYEDIVQVGFCGHSSSGSLQSLKTIFNVNRHNLKSLLSLSPFETNKQFYSPLHRKLILNKFKQSKSLKCDFVEREHYRAGITSGKENHQTTHEYFNNIYTNPYSIVVRGGGNFSRRFFDFCAMGRTPIFINYDSPIPFKEKLLEQNLLIEIDSGMNNFESKIMEYHQGLTAEDFTRRQVKIRDFWKEHYMKLGFYQQIHKQFSGVWKMPEVM